MTETVKLNSEQYTFINKFKESDEDRLYGALQHALYAIIQENTASEKLEDWLFNNKQLVIGLLMCTVPFKLEMPVYYVHFTNSQSDYLNRYCDGSLNITDNSWSNTVQTQFTREEVVDINPDYVPFMELVPEEEVYND